MPNSAPNPTSTQSDDDIFEIGTTTSLLEKSLRIFKTHPMLGIISVSIIFALSITILVSHKKTTTPKELLLSKPTAPSVPILKKIIPPSLPLDLASTGVHIASKQYIPTLPATRSTKSAIILAQQLLTLFQRNIQQELLAIPIKHQRVEFLATYTQTLAKATLDAGPILHDLKNSSTQLSQQIKVTQQNLATLTDTLQSPVTKNTPAIFSSISKEFIIKQASLATLTAQLAIQRTIIHDLQSNQQLALARLSSIRLNKDLLLNNLLVTVVPNSNIQILHTIATNPNNKHTNNISIIKKKKPLPVSSHTGASLTSAGSLSRGSSSRARPNLLLYQLQPPKPANLLYGLRQ